MGVCENLVKGNFTIKKTGDILVGSLPLRANAPKRMSQRLLRGQEEVIFAGLFALKVSEPKTMSTF